MKKLTVFCLLLLTACVTVNVYFPAADAENAADRIIKDIQKPAEPVKPKAGLSPWQRTVYHALGSALTVVVSDAYAQEANLSVESPEIRSVTAQLQSRFAQIKAFYDLGAVGLGSDGLVVLKDMGKVPLRDRNKVSKLVAAENADRERLYQAIANANHHPEWYDQIKSTFARRWIGNAQKGWWYQTATGIWKQK